MKIFKGVSKKIDKNRWRIWGKSPLYGEILYKRAIGELAEMESAKSLCQTLSPLYKRGMKLLDVGCGAGHYLRSLRLRLDKNIDYTGVDSTGQYIKLAKKAFGKQSKFFVGDILNLKFNSRAFDIVMGNNVILHLPPPPDEAISELIRVAKEYVIIRTVFGVRNYIIKEVRNSDEGTKRTSVKKIDLIDRNGNPPFYNYFNIYTEEYFKDIIKKINKNLKVTIIPDDKWAAFDNRKIAGEEATRVVDGKQVSGNLILDWRFIIIKK